jgi:YidC/Oxa1 family membrane protein insertase
MLEPNFFTTVFVFPILNLLVGLYKLFLLIKLPGAFGFAIIALTALIRLLFQPFFHKQMETTRKMQEIKPHLDKLSAKHKKDPKKLQQEQMRLYQEAGINPAMGCVLMIVQLPVFIALYNTLNLFLTNGTGAKIIASINKVLYHPSLHIATIDPWFFGFNLAQSPTSAKIWYYYLIPIVTGVLQYLQISMSTPSVAPATPDNKLAEVTLDEQGKEKKKDTGEDFQKAMNTQMKYMFPAMIAWFSFTLPVGLSLYWNIFSLFSIMQYRKVNGKKDQPKSSS